MSAPAPFVLAPALEFGIVSNSGTLIEAIDNDATVEVAELLDSTGEVARVHPYKNMSKGTVKGHGTTAIVPGVGNPGVGSPGGVTIITSFKSSEKNTEWNGWEYSYTVYPGAQSS